MFRNVRYTNSMKKISRLAVLLGVVAIPFLVSAQNYIGSNTTGTAWGSIKEIIEAIGKFINSTVMPMVVALAILYFMWNIAHFIGNMSNEKERETFKRYSINSLIGLFILLSVWGIVAIGTQTLFGKQPIVPQFRTNDNGGNKAP